MWIVNKEGNTTGQCDARCYDARFAYKDCICGGKNHAVGYAQAVMNTRDFFSLKKPPDFIVFAPFIRQRLLTFPSKS